MPYPPELIAKVVEIIVGQFKGEDQKPLERKDTLNKAFSGNPDTMMSLAYDLHYRELRSEYDDKFWQSYTDELRKQLDLSCELGALNGGHTIEHLPGGIHKEVYTGRDKKKGYIHIKISEGFGSSSFEPKVAYYNLGVKGNRMIAGMFELIMFEDGGLVFNTPPFANNWRDVDYNGKPEKCSGVATLDNEFMKRIRYPYRNWDAKER